MPITLKLSASGPWVTALALLVLSAGHGIAQKNYGPGVTDGEVKLGQTMPYSGPASALSAAGKAEAAYFAMVNAAGGVNRCRIKLISLDDSYTPPKTVEQSRKLIEQEKVLALFSPLALRPIRRSTSTSTPDVAGHQGQHRPERLYSHQAGPARALRRRTLGALRPYPGPPLTAAKRCRDRNAARRHRRALLIYWEQVLSFGDNSARFAD